MLGLMQPHGLMISAILKHAARTRTPPTATPGPISSDARAAWSA